MTLEQAIQEHIGKLPAHLQGEVLDYVLYLEQKPRKFRGNQSDQRQKIAKILAHLTAINPFVNADPADWERKQRQDRDMPGRS